jgi:hypothetical protein
MGKLTTFWTHFEVEKKHDIDKDAPYIWVFGIVVDVVRVADYKNSGKADFVITRKATWPNLGNDKFGKGDWVNVSPALNIDELTALPITGGVAVVAWESALTSASTQKEAYDAAVSAINEFIGEKVDECWSDIAGCVQNGVALSPADQEALRSRVENAVRDVFKSHLNLVHDHNIGSAQCVVSIEAGKSVQRDLDFIFDNGGTRYVLKGELRYAP